MARIYLIGEVQVELGENLLRVGDVLGRQGRLAFVYLVMERERAVPQSELADLLWDEGLPPSWPVALSAVISKLRARLGAIGLDRDRVIANALRCYQFRASEPWIDVEVAVEALHLAEGAILAGDPAAAYGPALVATTITRRPFLTGDDAPWISSQRDRLRDILLRARDAHVEALLANGELTLALHQAQEAVRLEPYRESGYRRLMQVLVRQGDRAQAVRVYEDCRRLLAEELGIRPSPETESMLRSLKP